jgi:hypothetical protein
MLLVLTNPFVTSLGLSTTHTISQKRKGNAAAAAAVAAAAAAYGQRR